MDQPATLPLEPSRPRERAFVEGLDALGDAELIALLLGTGTTGRSAVSLAADLLDALGGLEGLGAIGLAGLAEHPGLGPAKAARVGAALELGRRSLRRALERPRAGLASSAEVSAWGRARLAALEHEEIWLLALDGRNQLRAARRIAQGGLHGCAISVRDPLRVALREAASSFVLVHNHPSGDPSPSREDVELTNTVARAAETVGTPLVDHVIVAAAGHASMFDLGLLRPEL